MVATPFGQALLIFGLTFALQFADRSTFGVFSLAARHRGVDVWVGSALGFLAATSISIVIGIAAVTLLDPYLIWVRAGSGAVLVLFGLRELLRRPRDQRLRVEQQALEEMRRHRIWVASFGLILLLEVGGTTQVLAILFVAATGDPLLVLVAAWLALVTVTALEIRGTAYLRTRLRPETLERALGFSLLAVGAAAILLAFEPQLLPIPL